MAIMYIPAHYIRDMLRSATGPVELCDYNGNLLGSFVPAAAPEKRKPLEPPISEEELQARENDEGGCTTEELIASLEGFPCSP